MRAISQQHIPQRIVCLTEETTETLYLLGESDRIVGISGFTVRPAIARKEKPKVSAFTSAKIDQILALEPDLILGFSDLQAEIASTLIKQGIEVYVFNQRSVPEIYRMIRTLGALVGQTEQAVDWITHNQNTLQSLSYDLPTHRRKPRIYFEEWDNPLITGIQWVSELIEIAGGEDCFDELKHESLAKNRILRDPNLVIQRAPDIIIGSWCGKKFRADKVADRPGWRDIPAVQHHQLFEIKSANILQPGPAALTDGVQTIHKIIQQWYADELDRS